MTLIDKPRSPIQRWQALRVLPIALGFLSLTFTGPAFAQEKMARTLTVTGRGSELVQTTLSQVQLGVEVQAKTAEAAQKEAAQRSAAVVALLKSSQVERLETTGITLNPNYSYENNTQRLIGYVATNTVSFRVETPRAGNIIDQAVKQGATRINGISFVAPDAAIATARQQALREATADAQQQANAVLGALNLNAKEIVGIQINGASPPPPVYKMGFARAAAQEDATTPVEGAQQEVEANVTLEISY